MFTGGHTASQSDRQCDDHLACLPVTVDFVTLADILASKLSGQVRSIYKDDW